MEHKGTMVSKQKGMSMENMANKTMQQMMDEKHKTKKMMMSEMGMSMMDMPMIGDMQKKKGY